MIPHQARRRLQEVSRTLRPRAGGVENARDAVQLDRQHGDDRQHAALLQARALGPDSWQPLHESATYPVLRAPHGVHFWTTEAGLVGQLAAFVAGGIAEGQECLVVATSAHLAGLRRRLDLWGLATARVVELDAEDLLARLVGPDGLDLRVFDEAVGDRVREAAARPGGVRVFGEMVGVLTDRGDLETALELEHAWRELASTLVLPLLCAYRLSGTSADEELRRRACASHSHLVESAA